MINCNKWNRDAEVNTSLKDLEYVRLTASVIDYSNYKVVYCCGVHSTLSICTRKHLSTPKPMKKSLEKLQPQLISWRLYLCLYRWKRCVTVFFLWASKISKSPKATVTVWLNFKKAKSKAILTIILLLTQYFWLFTENIPLENSIVWNVIDLSSPRQMLRRFFSFFS